MASANMKDIKRRIKSVESTKQITKAMQLVASSKLRKAKEKADKARPFFDTLYDTMCEITARNNDFSSRFTAKRNVKTALLIVIAGDRGLAGGFNSNILKLALSRAEDLKGQGIEVEILPIGKKSAEFFEKRDFKVTEQYIGIGEQIDIYGAMSITDSIVHKYLHREFDKVELLYTTFVSALSQEPKNVEILPFKITGKNGVADQMTVYEPSPEAVFDYIVPRYISGLLFAAVVDSFASEQAARRTAMESASDNADEMIDNLSLIYNRARQAAITQEISEIVGGAKAQG